VPKIGSAKCGIGFVKYDFANAIFDTSEMKPN